MRNYSRLTLIFNGRKRLSIQTYAQHTRDSLDVSLLSYLQWAMRKWTHTNHRLTTDKSQPQNRERILHVWVSWQASPLSFFCAHPSASNRPDRKLSHPFRWIWARFPPVWRSCNQRQGRQLVFVIWFKLDVRLKLRKYFSLHWPTRII